MLIIRDQQCAAMKAALTLAFATSHIGYARRAWPGVLAKVGDDEILETLMVAASLAAGYGLTDYRSIMRIFHLIMLVGADFSLAPRYRPIVNILRRRTTSAPQRFAAVDRFLHALG